MTTSVVVVSYRPHRWIERCLTSVLDQADEVILIDNGSSERVVGDIGRRLGAQVETLATNLGFASGVNTGLRVARGDVVALLNDDAIASPEWLPSAEKVLADPTVAAVGPKIVFPWPFAEIHLDEAPQFFPGDPRPLARQIRHVEVDSRQVPLVEVLGPGVHRLEHRVEGDVRHQWRWTTGSGPIYIPITEDSKGHDVAINGEAVPVEQRVQVVSNAGSYLSSRGHGGDYGFGASDDGRFDTATERFATTGAAMVARAETFVRLGGFADSYFAYYEDLDWCWRARLAGLRSLYEPAAVVQHVGGASTGGPMNDRVLYLAARNRIQTLARNAPLRVLAAELRSPADRPESGTALPLAKRVAQGLLERRTVGRLRRKSPAAVWREWAGRDERW